MIKFHPASDFFNSLLKQSRNLRRENGICTRASR